MGSRLARTTLAAFAVAAVVALPVSLAAPASARDDRAAATAEHGKPEEKPGKGNDGEHGNKHDAAPEAAQGRPTAAPTTEPQPQSNADLNPGGANNGGDCGAYCSTRDGSPSENGKGDGTAVGKPCAGCVGKADNKNPPGQAPDGTDHNAGYECDRNQGIGKTNPAHTGCTPAPSVSPTATPSCVPSGEETCEPPCVPTANEPCEPCVPTTEEPCETESPSPSVSGTVSTPPASPSPSVKGVRIVRPRVNPPAVAGGRLPTTGTNVSIVLLLLVGFGLLGTGMALTVGSPARHH